jgi:hypothetical protein
MKKAKKMGLLLLTLIVGLTACEKKTDCGECIDPSIMGGPYIEIYDPVCGCDDKTYSNSAHAMSEGGVTSWTEGPCEEIHENECVDSSLIIVDYQVYTVACFAPPQPVCGCDGNTYSSAGKATYVHGIKKYTSGSCESVVDDCIDSSLITVGKNGPIVMLAGGTVICELPSGPDVLSSINGTRISELTIVPDTLWADQTVCGCDGKSYISGFEATNVHGVKSYTPGPCFTLVKF